MNKFVVTEKLNGIEINTEYPNLYKVYFGDKYYLHKSKKFQEGYTKFLDDIFRGMRGFKYGKEYKNVVDLCLKYPSLYKVTVDLISNDEPPIILMQEKDLLEMIKTDTNSLNDPSVEQFRPEWMMRHILGQPCDKCPSTGTVNKKKRLFNFCPVCGRSIKETVL